MIRIYPQITQITQILEEGWEGALYFRKEICVICVICG